MAIWYGISIFPEFLNPWKGAACLEILPKRRHGYRDHSRNTELGKREMCRTPAYMSWKCFHRYRNTFYTLTVAVVTEATRAVT
jgi:hypothetical protein